MAASSRPFSSDGSEDCEIHSLLQQPNNVQLRDTRKKSPCRIGTRYRLPIITEKGAIVMIVWNMLFAISLFSCIEFKSYTISVRAVFVACTTVSYPLIGWLADSRFGKFKVLRVGSFLLMISIIFKNIGIFITHSILKYLHYTSLLTWSLAWACHFSCIIPFATDQSVGASAEQLSFTVQWLLWGLSTGYCIVTINSFLMGFSEEFSVFRLSLVSFLIAFIFLECCHHHVMTKPVISNPIKLIVQVLNYACKHKYPERRSALTYWEEDYPSRLDLGKDKYGGPFTFEQVEDVKTVLRLIPLLVCISTLNILFWKKNHLMHYYSNCSSNYKQFFYLASHFSPLSAALVYFVGLPIYYFLIFPLLRKYVFTIMRAIGLGMLLMILAFLATAIVELVDATQSGISANTTCIFSNPISNGCPSSYRLLWIILPDLLKSLGGVIFCFGMYELIIAQTPQHFKGLLLSISTGFTGVFILASYVLDMFLTRFPVHFFPNCLFYYYMSYFTLGTLAFILYVLVAKWYKLRIRDDIVPYHMIAEEYFEREQANRSAFIEAQQLEYSDEK